jgi:hypothetical protein
MERFRASAALLAADQTGGPARSLADLGAGDPEGDVTGNPNNGTVVGTAPTLTTPPSGPPLPSDVEMGSSREPHTTPAARLPNPR